MKSYKKVMLITVLALSLTACSGSVKKVPYTEVGYGTTTEQLTEAVGEEANSVESENGLSQYIYEKSQYLDYNGKMTYYMLDNSCVFSRWEYIAKNEEKGKQVYQKICEQMKKDYGESISSDSENSAIFETQNNIKKTVLFTNDANGSVISIVDETIQSTDQETNHSETETNTSEPQTTEKTEEDTSKSKSTKKTKENTSKPKDTTKSVDKNNKE